MGRSRAHRKVQKEGRERYGNRCAFCRRTVDELEEGEQIEGHHIIEYHDGGLPRAENIIPLCTTCHRAYHNGEIDVDIVAF